MTSQRARPESILRRVGGEWRQERRRGEGDFFRRVQVLAACENARLPWFGIAHDHDARQLVAFVFGDLLLEFLDHGRFFDSRILGQDFFGRMFVKVTAQRLGQGGLLFGVAFVLGDAF